MNRMLISILACAALAVGSLGRGATEAGAERPTAKLGVTAVAMPEPGAGLPVALDETPGPAGGQAVAGTGEWVMAPIPFINPLVGYGLAGGVGYIYHPKDADPKLAPWVTGVGGFYSENKSWALALGHKMNLDHDTWRVSALAGYGLVYYDFYGVGATASQNRLVALKQSVMGGTAEGLYRVRDHLYAGLGYTLTRVTTHITSTGLPPWINDIITRGQLGATLSTPALRMQWDTRDDSFYPTHGWLVDGEAAFSTKMLGSSFDYQAVSLTARHYWSLSDTQVVAAYVYGRRAYGDVPFFAMSMIGAKGNLRGYTAGRYQDYLAMSGQVEYRWQAMKRLGLVAFGGVGAVGEDLSGLAHADALPSVGGGVRYLLAEQNHLNFRVDVAWGRDDTLIYVSVGEAF
jgi:hypothetical protein